MNRTILARISLTSLLLTATLFGACTDQDLPTAGYIPEEPAFVDAPMFSRSEELTLMTRNMYLGGDVGLVFGAAMTNPAAVPTAAQEVWNQIQSTNFPERAGALAQEIAQHQPHLVGIQEIPLFEIMAGPTGPVIENLVQDNLAILMAYLAGEPYSVATDLVNTSATFPINLPGLGDVYIRFTDRIAVLVRDDLDTYSVTSGHYAAGASLMEGMLELKRGWIQVSAEFNGVPYHFVNTHLETQTFSAIQAGQVAELLGSVLPGLDGVTVLLGDLNSDAEAGPDAPSWTPSYGELIAAGFQDTWETANPGVPEIGFTCCQVPLLNNPASDLDERIDFILLRSQDRKGGKNRIPGATHLELVGADPASRTPSGLWPADHAGLVASLKLATGIFRNP
jgi:hypothetical protein